MILTPWERVYEDIVGKNLRLALVWFFSRNCSNKTSFYVILYVCTYT